VEKKEGRRSATWHGFSLPLLPVHPFFPFRLSSHLPPPPPKSVYVYAGRVIATNYPNDDTIKISRRAA